MTKSRNIEQEVYAVLNETLTLPPDVLLTPQSGPDQVPGWDSLSHTNIVLAMEEKFAVSFDMDELLAMNSVAAFVETIEKKTAAVEVDRA